MKTCLITLFLCAASLLPQAMAATPADVARKSFQETKIKAEKGDAAAQFALGLMYDVGQGVPKDEAEAVKWIRKAADQEHARAQYNLGVMYATGDGVPKDEAEAVKWWRKAADQEHAPAQALLGVMYGGGRGVPKDETEAYKWYLLAGAQGDEMAKKKISIIEGNITPAQRAEGQRLAREFKPRTALQELAAEPTAAAPKNFVETKAKAEQGDDLAQFNLGEMYMNGKGVVKDAVEAVKWYRKAADQGLANGQLKLGIAYLGGEGVVKNGVEAVKWFRKAANQGNADAQFFLGSMHELGLGVVIDWLEAYKWYLLRGSSIPIDEMALYARKGSKRMEDVLTPQQRAEGQKFAREWEPRKP